ncbi:hypothetical protein AYO44_12335 [Planctomycetaceae bacterium SCGC AG-212-F19]|nr:hypothetical protein AYO44_12335 [Planctomycetaceae bacterium SCGC AG-212-F19]
MQIRELVLYSHTGEIRRLPFKLGVLNVIAGESGTGKSALINIVDYCFGRDSCPIPARVIRDAVKWYGLLLQFGKGQVFVARAAPVPPLLTNSEIHYTVGDTIDIPPMDRLLPNTNPSSLNGYLTRMMGVSENLNVPPLGQTRDNLEATLQHAKLLALQYQDEIAKKDLLFHRQGESFIAQAIKDTLPYFLGAVEEDQLKIRHELTEARRALRGLERRLRDAEAIGGAAAGRSAALVREAQAIGLLPADDVPTNSADILALLRQVQFTPAAERAGSLAAEMRRLRVERSDLQREHERLQREIADAEAFAAGSEAFEAVANEQRVRLESVKLFGGEPNNTCPLCEQSVETKTPRVARVRESLESVAKHVEAVGRERPSLTEHIKNKSAEMAAVAERLATNREALNAITARDNELRAQQEQDVVRSRVAGRIEMYLEGASAADDNSELRTRVANAQKKVTDLEPRLGEDDAEEVLASALNQVSQQMTKWCGELGLEYSPFPLRLDIKKLTVIADTTTGPVPMAQMGSGQNWVWCHLLAHLALHKWFVDKGRPVPRFLILDQPTQVYYPAERDAGGSLDVLKDSDREGVLRMFRWLKARVDELKGQFQVIVTDHAEVKEPWFEEARVERWRGGNALVPRSWSSKREVPSSPAVPKQAEEGSADK